MKKVDYIVCSDIHFRSTVPKARTDNYFEAQKNKILFIKELQEKYGCLVLCAGDVFDRWNTPPEFEAWAVNNWPANFVTIPGQHDLPQHNRGLYHKSSLAVLDAAEKVTVFNYDIDCLTGSESTNHIIYGFPWGATIQDSEKKSKIKIALIHKLITEKENDFLVERAGAVPANKIMDRLKTFDLIITGDNHKQFVIKRENQLLINPGSMMRMTADQKEHTPGVYLVNSDLDFEFIPFKINKEAITRQYIEKQNKKDERIEAFVKRIDSNYDVELSFEKNIQSFLATNKVRKGVQELIMEAIDNG